MIAFDWDTVRPKLNDGQPTREAVIRSAFQQWLDGNDGYEDLNDLELQGLFDLFRASWIICEHTVGAIS